MANPEHVKILKQGVEVWNRWREENPDVKPDFSDADLRWAILSGTDLIGANLREANLSGADFSHADLTFANLIGSDLKGTNIKNASLNWVKLKGANLSGKDLSKTNLTGANLAEANLTKADLWWGKLAGSDLRCANLSRANLSDACLNKAWLDGAELTGAHLIRTDLSDADLIGANLRKVQINFANLSGADLSAANFSGADLSGANLSGANLSGTKFSNTSVVNTVFANVDLSNVKGIETVKHYGPTTIGIDTIFLSNGKIPESFLRGCGVPENFIQYMSSLTAKAFEYYSCFISYSSKDQGFAERLYADLQNKNVRCWFAPEDMKIGDKIRDRIDQSIRIHDKLLLVLSENSINSEWVEDEVEAAYEQERQRGKTVLFPIRLDTAVMDTDKAWAAKLRRSRHIGDFAQWKDHDAYQKAFDRLMRDLKAEEPAGSD